MLLKRILLALILINCIGIICAAAAAFKRKLLNWSVRYVYFHIYFICYILTCDIYFNSFLMCVYNFCCLHKNGHTCEPNNNNKWKRKWKRTKKLHDSLGSTKTVKNNHRKKSIHSDRLTDIFHPYSAQFTLIKTDQNANVKWGVRFYRN